MTIKTIITFNFIFFQLLLTTQLFSQHILTKYASNPIMVKADNMYEGNAIGSPSVILKNDTLRMFYAAGAKDSRGRINYAYSIDGTSWTKYNSTKPVLDLGEMGSWDDYFLDTPEIIEDSSGFKLYYFGDTDNFSAGSAIGVATSTDLINWTRAAENPIIGPGNEGDWDGLFIESPTVTFSDGTYYMLYSGIDTTWSVRIGLATSPDGINWTKYAGNPVIDVGVNTSWEGFGVATPSILKTDTGFEMWYCGVSFQDILDNNQVDTIKIGYATSSDAMNWVKHASNPILNTYSPPYTHYENYGPWTPDVIYWPDSSKYYMWYETGYGFGMASSPNIMVGLNTLNSKSEIVNIYPNPATQIININGLKIDEVITIYDVFGQFVKKQSCDTSTEINIADIAKGIYFIRLQSNQNQTYKFIKQ